MSRISCVVLVGILASVPGLSLGQSYGVPEGSRFQPVITDRMICEAQEGRSGNSDKGARKQRSVASAKPKVSRPAEGKAAPEVRTWTDDTGTHTVEASFVALEAERVTLKKTDGNKVILPLSRLSKNDQEYAKAQARCQQIMEEFKEADQLEQTIKNLNYRIRNAASSSAKANLEKQLIEVSGKYRELVDEREQKIRKATNDYFVATGREPPYVDDGWGKLEAKEVLAKRETDRKEREAVAKVSGTPRLAADNYVRTLLGNGTLREAAYLAEQFVTPGPQRSSMDRALGQAFGVGGGGGIGPIADPTKWKAVYYRVKYVSQAGLLIEKDAYVLTYRKENARVIGAGARPEDGAVWGVEGLHIDGVAE